jgi:DNA invertase Pin-like site-specific DNA recombinase
VAELAEDDRGASGADWDLPKLNEALDMARENGFDVLVTRELDRFASPLAKQLVVESEFKRHIADLLEFCHHCA